MLSRRWLSGSGVVAFVGLNPSTADETLDDPTIRRCIGYAKAWGYAGLAMINLFAFRATNPNYMIGVSDPVGPDNDSAIAAQIAAADLAVAAWGMGGAYRRRGRFIHAKYPQLKMLRLTKEGHPAHPLYLPKSLMPQEWRE